MGMTIEGVKDSSEKLLSELRSRIGWGFGKGDGNNRF